MPTPIPDDAALARRLLEPDWTDVERADLDALRQPAAAGYDLLPDEPEALGAHAYARAWGVAVTWPGGRQWERLLARLVERTPPPRLVGSAADPGLEFAEVPEAGRVARYLLAHGMSAEEVRALLSAMRDAWRRLGYKPPGRWTADDLAGLMALAEREGGDTPTMLSRVARAVWQAEGTDFARRQLETFVERVASAE